MKSIHEFKIERMTGIMENRKETLYRLIKKQMGEEEITLEEDMLLIEHLGFDSVQLIMLVVDIETEFQIEFKESNLLFEKFDRIGDLLKLIEELCEKGEGHGDV